MEGVLPFDQKGIAIMTEAVGLPVANAVGARLNASAYDKIGLRHRDAYKQSPTIIDASTVQNVSNNTLIRPPSPSGPGLHFERRDFVHKIA